MAAKENKVTQWPLMGWSNNQNITDTIIRVCITIVINCNKMTTDIISFNETPAT